MDKVALYLPNGKETSDRNLWRKEWDSIVIPLEQKYDCAVFAFGPSLSIEDNKSTATALVPLWLAIRMIK
jgi:hypothetical protein